MDILADLNEPQLQAVTHKDGPLLVLAGAGSGKTRVITRRLAWLTTQGVQPWNILALTFTNKAAQEMRERVEQLGCPRGSTVCTFHALCARLLREMADEAGMKSGFSVYDRDDQVKVAKQAIADLDLSAENFPPSRVHGAISRAKNDMKTPAELAQEAGTFYARNIAKIYEKYEQLLRAANAMDFDDLLLRTAWLLRDRPEIRQFLGRRYRYIMIDEYQDTNHAQYVIAHGIGLDHENICATGDPDQSIYAWRGADIHNILEFEKDYPTAVVVRLEENYRSSAPILAAASHLISNNKLRKEKALWTRREGGASVRVIACDDEHAEARLVAKRIAAHHAAGGRWDDVAVFYRVNSLSRVMEEALLKSGIPYRIARGVEFYNRKEIKDVLAYLRLLVNAADDISFLRAVNTPARGIGATTVGKLADFAVSRGISLLDACRMAAQAGLPSSATAKLMGFAAMIDALRSNLDRPAKEVLEDVLAKSGISAALAGEEEEQRQSRANVDELISAAAEFDEHLEPASTHEPAGETPAGRKAETASRRPPRPIEEYLLQVSLVSDLDHMEGSSGAVTLMTMHAAKGLEFPVVFIVGAEEGLLPFERGDENDWDVAASSARLEEERRLAFVGITRAENALTLTHARSRIIRGQTTAQAQSRFLREIGEEGVTFEDACTQDRYADRGQSRGGFFSGDWRENAPDRPRPAADAEWDVLADAHEVPLPEEYERLRVGSTVVSPKFGRGKVVSLGHEPWPHTRVKVDFAGLGTKTLMLSVAKLTVQ